MNERTLPERVAMLEQAFISINDKMVTACGSIEKIEIRLMSRPSWSVLTIISLLSTITASLIIFIVTKTV